VNLELTLDNIDLYDSHYPMTWFGFGAARGRLRWNPGSSPEALPGGLRRPLYRSMRFIW
jgi:hypothetical protein